MMTNKPLSDFQKQLDQVREKYWEQQKQESGISGYCICCGASRIIASNTQDHDPECIWYEQVTE